MTERQWQRKRGDTVRLKLSMDSWELSCYVPIYLTLDMLDAHESLAVKRFLAPALAALVADMRRKNILPKKRKAKR